MSTPKHKAEQQTAPDPAEQPQSLNEPPGSDIGGAAEPEPPPEPEVDSDELPSESELWTMKRSELDELAESRGLDPHDYSNKEEVIHALIRDAKKRKR